MGIGRTRLIVVREIGAARYEPMEPATGIAWPNATPKQRITAVLTTHGCNGVERFFLGSTMERVARHAPCPVSVIRKTEHSFIARRQTRPSTLMDFAAQ